MLNQLIGIDPCLQMETDQGPSVAQQMLYTHIWWKNDLIQSLNCRTPVAQTG